MHLTQKQSKLFWNSLLIVALFGGGWIFKLMIDRIEYTWYWNRVPQYFMFTGEVTLYSPIDGEVISIEPSGDDKTTLSIKKTGGHTKKITLTRHSVEVSVGQHIKDGELLGTQLATKVGILLIGLWTTLTISTYATIIGLFLGLFAGLARISKNPLFKGLSSIYVELVRGTPLLVQIFIIYYFVDTVLQMGRLGAGASALGIFAGAYVAEIVRAGIQSIDKGQMEAARSLGMTTLQAMRHIILPQAFKRIVPPLAGQFISLIKDSSLVSVIAITDLTKAGREVITSTFATFEIWFTVAAMYFVLTYTLSLLTKVIERRLGKSD